MPSIQLGDDTIQITPPGSPSLALALVRVARHSPEWAGGAALVACHPELAAKAGATLDRRDLESCGAKMYDWLVDRLVRHYGASGRDALTQAGQATAQAFDACMAAIPLEAEVQEVEGNSEPTP